MEKFILGGASLFGVSGTLLGIKIGADQGWSTSTRFRIAIKKGAVCGCFGGMVGGALGLSFPLWVLASPVAVPVFGSTYWYARHVQNLSETNKPPVNNT